MGILTKEVQVKPTGKMIKYYRDKGYDAEYKKLLIVKVEDLPEHSDKMVDVLCDYCGKQIFSVRYHAYNQEKIHINKHACKSCWQKKAEDVIMKKYGVTNLFYLKDIQEKREKTMMTRYGVLIPLQSGEIK